MPSRFMHLHKELKSVAPESSQTKKIPNFNNSIEVSYYFEEIIKLKNDNLCKIILNILENPPGALRIDTKYLHQLIDKNCPSLKNPEILVKKVEAPKKAEILPKAEIKKEIQIVSDAQEKIVTDCLINIVGPLGPMLIGMHQDKKTLGMLTYLQAITSSMDQTMREKFMLSVKNNGIVY